MDYSCDRRGAMRIAVSDAKAQLTELVRRAEAGEEVVLTRHGQPAVQLTPVKKTVDKAARRALIEKLAASASAKATPGPSAARSQDFLYGPDGLPE
jgi:prevent-host-death family protein